MVFFRFTLCRSPAASFHADFGGEPICQLRGQAEYGKIVFCTVSQEAHVATEDLKYEPRIVKSADW